VVKLVEAAYLGEYRDIVVFGDSWYLADLETVADGIPFVSRMGYFWEFEDSDWIRLGHIRSGDGGYIIDPYRTSMDGAGFLFNIRIRRIGSYIYVPLSASPSSRVSPRSEKL